LRFDLTPDNILAHVVLLGEVEKFTNLGRTLGAETLGQHGVSETRKFIITLLDDDKRENRNIRSNDAATNGLATSLALPSLTIA
jgi:hypothetical protein